jgi:hypothetical protein
MGTQKWVQHFVLFIINFLERIIIQSLRIIDTCSQSQDHGIWRHNKHKHKHKHIWNEQGQDMLKTIKQRKEWKDNAYFRFCSQEMNKQASDLFSSEY